MGTGLASMVEWKRAYTRGEKYDPDFFFVAQMRPDYIPAANKHDEDVFSDEEIEWQHAGVQKLLQTHTGSIKTDEQVAETDDISAEAECREAIQKASRLWAKEPKGETWRRDVNGQEQVKKLGDASIKN